MTDWHSAFAKADGNKNIAKEQIDQELSKFTKTVSKEINTGDSKIDERPQSKRTDPNRNYRDNYNKKEYVVGNQGYKPRGRGGYRGDYQNGDNRDGDFKVRERGRGGYFRGDRGDRGRGNYRGNRGRGRGGYHNAEKFEQADNDDDNENDELTVEEYMFISEQKKKHSEKLKGIVNEDQIGRKCIDLQFDEARVQGWVNTLLASGDHSWVDTATRVDKINQKKQAQIRRENWKKFQAEKAERQKRWEEKQKFREERKKKHEEKMAADAAKKAEKEKEQAATETNEDNNNEDEAKLVKVKDDKGTRQYRQVPKQKEETPEVKTEEVKEAKEEEAAVDEEYNEEYYEEEEYEQENEEPVGEDAGKNDVAPSEGGSDAALLDEAVAPKTQEEEVCETPKIEPKKEVEEKEKTPEVKEEPAPEPKKEEQATPMNMGMPAMMPPMTGMKQEFKPGDSISLQQSQQIMNDAQQHMMYCWQMLQHYQVVYNQQLVYQQQLMNTSGNQADQQQFMSNMNMNFGMNPMMMPGMGHGDQQNMIPPMAGMMPFYPQNGQAGNFFMGANQSQNKES